MSNYNLLSIDVGLINLALVYSLIGPDHVLIKILEVNLIDITDYQNCNCTDLLHEKTISNYMKHLFREYSRLFNDIVIFEMQPITGLTAVEQIICYEFPNTIRISPRSMHCYFTINNLDYEHRKIKTVEIAENYLKDIDNYNNYRDLLRKHDIADAVCIMLFYLSKLRSENIAKNLEQKFKHNLDLLKNKHFKPSINMFQEFAFKDLDKFIKKPLSDN